MSSFFPSPLLPPAIWSKPFGLCFPVFFLRSPPFSPLPRSSFLYRPRYFVLFIAMVALFFFLARMPLHLLPPLPSPFPVAASRFTLPSNSACLLRPLLLHPRPRLIFPLLFFPPSSFLLCSFPPFTRSYGSSILICFSPFSAHYPCLPLRGLSPPIGNFWFEVLTYSTYFAARLSSTGRFSSGRGLFP